MAKNVTLMGANYSNVPAVQLPQTGGGTATFYDIQVIDNLTSDSATDALSAKQGKALNTNKKGVQTAVSDPTASGNSATFIDTISQNTQGVISATKKTVRSASQSQSGLMSSADKTKLDNIKSETVTMSQWLYGNIVKVGINASKKILSIECEGYGAIPYNQGGVHYALVFGADGSHITSGSITAVVCYMD